MTCFGSQYWNWSYFLLWILLGNKSQFWQFLHILPPGPPPRLSSSCLFLFWCTPPLNSSSTSRDTLSFHPFHLFQKLLQEGSITSCLYLDANGSQYLNLEELCTFLKMCPGLLVDLSVFFICILVLKDHLKYSQEYFVLNVTCSYDIVDFKWLL